MVTGGFKTSLPIVRTFDAKSLENNQVVDSLPDEEGARTLVGCGAALLDQEVVIVDPETMTHLPDSRVGEIWVAGPSVAQGYWRRAEETANTFRAYLKDSGRGPYLRTGDLGFVHNGELFVTGRLKDLIIIHGRNHYPQDIEQTVERAHPLLRPALVAFLRSISAAANGWAWWPKSNAAATALPEELEEVFDAIRRTVSADHEMPVDAIVLIKAGSIPKTSSGKIQRHACRNGFLRGKDLEVVAQWRSWESASPQAPSAAAGSTSEPAAGPVTIPFPATAQTLPRSAVEALSATPSNGHGTKHPGLAESLPPISDETAVIVMQQITRVAKERAKGLSLDSNILEMSMDSLERMEIVAALEDTFGGRFPEEVLPDMITVRDVVAAVEKYLGKTPRKRSDTPIGRNSRISITPSINSPSASPSNSNGNFSTPWA